jgi:4-hydroxymandelate synthase
VRGAAAAAVAGGAAVVAEPSMWGWGDAVGVSAVVSGPGGVVHRMVQRAGVGGQFLAGLVPVLPEPEGEGEGLLHGVDHVAWCVPGDELGSVTDFYRRVFGLVEVFRERIEVGEQVMDSRVVQSGSRQVTFTIVCPDGGTRSGQLVDFLAGNAGAGVQHLALGTRDIAAAVDRFQGRGLRFLAAPDSYYDAVAGRLGRVSLPVDDLRARSILVDRDHHGEMFQIFSESPFARETFFFELIERHGALTFGSNNVRALYEAKERARAGGGGDRVVAGVGGEVDA